MNKNILIIGGSGGVGLSVGEIFQKSNANVYSTYFNKKPVIKKDNCNVEFLKCDLRDENNISSVIDYILKKEKKIDVVINLVTPNLKLKTFDQLSTEEFKEDIDVIILGSANLYRKIIPMFKLNKHGIIINCLSESIVDSALIRMSSYITAKMGLYGLTKCLAKELESFGVFVFGLSPSFVETDLIKSFPEKLLEIERDKRTEKKFILPQDLAALIKDMVDNYKKYRTGDNIIVRTKKDIYDIIG